MEREDGIAKEEMDCGGGIQGENKDGGPLLDVEASCKVINNGRSRVIQ